MEHDKTEGYDTTPAARVRSGCAWLRDFVEVWGNQEAGSEYLLQPKRCEYMAEELQQALEVRVLKVFDAVRNREREYRPATDADALAKGDVRLLTASVNAWLLGEGLAPIAGTPSSGNAAPAAPVEPTPAPSASLAAPEPVAPPAEAVPVTPKGVQRQEMVKRHVARWRTIKADMKGAATNGLADAAKAGERGWREADALEWAKVNSRLLSAPEPGTLDAVMGGGFPSIRHTLAR